MKTIEDNWNDKVNIEIGDREKDLNICKSKIKFQKDKRKTKNLICYLNRKIKNLEDEIII